MSLNIFKSIETRSLRAVIPVVFALIFTIPLLIFFHCVIYYGLLHHRLIQLSFVVYFTFSLLGYMLLRQIIDRVIELSTAIMPINHDTSVEVTFHEENELEKIASTFQKLVEKLEENTVNLGKRVKELGSLSELTEISSKIIDIKQLYGTVLEKLMITTDAKFGIIMSVSSDCKRLKPEAARGINELMISKDEIDINSSISGRVFNENLTLVCDDPAKEEGFNPANDAAFEGGPFIAKTIKARGNSTGVINLSRGKNGKKFEDSEVDYITTALTQIAFALDNAQLLQEIKEAYNELKETQQKLVDYERASAINQTVVTLSDKINTPLTVIQGHTEIIRKNTGPDNPKIFRSLDLIEESISRCIKVMKKLSEINEYSVTDYPGGETKMIDIENDQVESIISGSSYKYKE